MSAAPAPTLNLDAPAKVNLALAVTGRRDDGYHSLHSVFLRLALHDELTVETGSELERDELEVVGNLEGPVEENLVLRAVADLRSESETPLPWLRFVLTKRIPAAAGLGGGSSDAAAALQLALDAWGVRLHPTARLGAAMRLGADVPFFAGDHVAALARGIGERLQPLVAPSPPAGILLITPAQRLSTARVFAELDRLPPDGGVAATAVETLATAMEAGLDGAGLASLSATLRDGNDLWAPAARLSDSLDSLRSAMESMLQRPVLLTGSGTTLFAIYPTPDAATDAAVKIEPDGIDELKGAVITATATASADANEGDQR